MNIGEQIILNCNGSSLPHGMPQSGPPKNWRIPQGLPRVNELYSTGAGRDYTYIDDIIDGLPAEAIPTRKASADWHLGAGGGDGGHRLYRQLYWCKFATCTGKGKSS